ncbi:hypothetical protein VNO80_15569 [Phaseolus coccineus]|uniref:Endonuclease/exonuclease/phosphatase domain-containing protein n=1 Tax=Phaseolus coccineus TaxID=3886 RepID=A0AAN9QZD3_PHACN
MEEAGGALSSEFDDEAQTHLGGNGGVATEPTNFGVGTTIIEGEVGEYLYNLPSSEKRSLKEVQSSDGAIQGDVSLKLSREGSINSRSEADTLFEGNKSEVTGLPNVGVGMTDIVGQIGDLMGLSQSPETRRIKEVRRSDVLSREGPQTNLINHRDNSDIGIVEMERSVNMFGEEGEYVKESYKTPERGRRLRTLRETDELRVQPRWRSKGGQGSLHYGNSSSSRFSILSNAESASDIIHCNNRLRNEEFVDESVRIWEVGKQLGMECLGDEGMVTSQLKACNLNDKVALWEDLTVVKGAHQNLVWCFCGDFNAVRTEDERKGARAMAERKHRWDCQGVGEQVGVDMDVAAARMDFIIYADLNVELCRFPLSDVAVVSYQNLFGEGVQRYYFLPLFHLVGQHREVKGNDFRVVAAMKIGKQIGRSRYAGMECGIAACKA